MSELIKTNETIEKDGFTVSIQFDQRKGFRKCVQRNGSNTLTKRAFLVKKSTYSEMMYFDKGDVAQVSFNVKLEDMAHICTKMDENWSCFSNNQQVFLANRLYDSLVATIKGKIMYCGSPQNEILLLFKKTADRLREKINNQLIKGDKSKTYENFSKIFSYLDIEAIAATEVSDFNPFTLVNHQLG